MIRDSRGSPFEKKVWFSSPTMHGDEQRWITDAFEKNWITTARENINEVEKLIAEYIGIPCAVGFSCGTAALQSCHSSRSGKALRYAQSWTWFS